MSSAVRRWAVRGVQGVAGLMLALAVAEGIFWWRDHGAFPHVNFYLPDPTLGARLRPGATERISFGGNAVTRARVNRDGFRGADLPPPGDNEILVVGDSQVFGLGVEEEATFSARLAATLGRPVVNAGVPTYGPEEYGAVIAEVLPRRHPRTVVYVVNLANDLFEASHPNRERHAIWDGWAVRREMMAPATTRPFPGRAWLFGQSHLVYAMRRYVHARGGRGGALGDATDATVDNGFASEGTWSDLLGAGRTARQAHEAARKEIHERADKLYVELSEVESREEGLERQLYRKVDFQNLAGPMPEELQGFALEVGRSAAGDIVRDTGAEEERSLVVTAELLRKAAEVRNRVEENLRRRADDPQKATARKAKKALEGWTEWQRLAKQHDGLVAAPVRFVRHRSPLLPHIQRAKALCDAAGARLVVVALPLDVMVSPTEWKKYGAPPVDLAAAHILVEDLVRASEEIGLAALDATAALAAAEPGAFLDHDLHMSPRGHAALAGALAAKLAEAPPLPLPTGELPVGRRRPPRSDSWQALENDAPFTGGMPDACRIRRLAEWIRFFCFHEPGEPGGVTLVRGGHGDAIIFVTNHSTLLLAPVLAGDSLAADLEVRGGTRRLDIRWRVGAPEPEIIFRALSHAAPAGARADDGPRIALARKLLHCTYPKGEPRDTYDYIYLQMTADLDCDRTYPDDCQRLWECASGHLGSPPECPPGQANAGATNRCHALCGPGRPCAKKGETCVPWPGTQICE